MAGTRAAARLLVTDGQRAGLEAIANSPSLPHRAVRQARGLLDAADGVANEEIGRRCGVSANTVRAWRKSFHERGVAGVGVVAEGRGRKPWLPEGMVAEVVRVTLTEKPADGSTHWSTRTLAARMGISHGAVANIWRDHELRPWRTEPSSCPPTRTSRPSWSTLSASTWIRRRRRWCSLRREDTGASAGSDPAEPADGARSGRDDDARLQAQRHH